MQNRLGVCTLQNFQQGSTVKLGRAGRVRYQGTLRPRAGSDLNAVGVWGTAGQELKHFEGGRWEV